MTEKGPERELVRRFCRDCIYNAGGICHLTPREREVRDTYWCSHGTWYEFNLVTGMWETHMHGEIAKPDMKNLLELIKKESEHDPEQ